MRFCTAVFALLLLASVGIHENRTRPPTSVQPNESSVDWKDDEVCRTVFFAVLEGLYRDGVSDEVVDNVIGPKSSSTEFDVMKQRMKRSFVMDCPLCQPTFEAFLVYQNRPRFNDGSGASHFGDGLDDEVRQRLLSDETMARLRALRIPVQRWVLARLNSKEAAREHRFEWAQTAAERSSQGLSRLNDLIRSSDHYRNWSTYWGCAACGAVTSASNQWSQEPDQ